MSSSSRRGGTNTLGVLVTAVVLNVLAGGLAPPGAAAVEVAVTEAPNVSGSLRVAEVAPPGPRDLDAYAGLGTWVDAFDFAPAYGGDPPPLDASAVDDMADRGVRTVFLQATRWDDGSPEGYVDRARLRAFLIAAHERGLRVVGWYLPEFDDLDVDLERVAQILDFEASGHRFDGVAIDIEWTESVPDDEERSDRLVTLSRRIDELAGEVPVAAVVLPAVQLEVVNERYWPDFPYRAIRDHYDVWMPMAYWSFRGEPYDDGDRYVTESVNRLRANLGRPDARVAPIGGIADDVSDDEVGQFAEALAQVGAIGGSMYDWNTLPNAKARLLQEAFATGPASSLPDP